MSTTGSKGRAVRRRSASTGAPRASATAYPAEGQEVSFAPLVRVLWVLIGVLVVMGALVDILDDAIPEADGPVRGSLDILRRWFDLDAESNIPTWTSILLLAAVALAFAAVAMVQRATGAPAGRYWFFSAVALYLSVDEGAQVHEEFGRVITQFVDRDALLTFTWIIPGLLLAAVVGFVLLRLARGIPATLRRRLLLAGVVYLGGAAVVEAISGLFVTHHPDGGGGQSIPYRIFNSLEEGMEMAGVLLALAAVLGVLRLRRTRTGLALGVAETVSHR